jgi:hypothetical protein
MSLKKELLYKLSEKQLKELAKSKGIEFTLNTIQEKYYKDWDEKDKIVDLMSDQQQLTVSDIEKYIMQNKTR